MSKQDDISSASIKLKVDKNFAHNLFHALSYNVTNDVRVKTHIKLRPNELDIDIKANDFNILLAVNNNLMQSIKMLEIINGYE
ncbi:MAG: hypothetical protein QXL94_03185 [Candidatus Parvarchaeum sp.]